MTRRARELGALRTSFRNANGLHHAEHYTTARDLAVISRAAMQQPFFRQIVGTRAFEWLRRACEERATALVNVDVEPAFDGLRADPRFAGLRRCVGLS